MCGYRVVCAELAAVVCCKHSDFGRLCRSRIECNQRTQRSVYEIMRLVALACNGQRFAQRWLCQVALARCRGEPGLGRGGRRLPPRQQRPPESSRRIPVQKRRRGASQGHRNCRLPRDSSPTTTLPRHPSRHHPSTEDGRNAITKRCPSYTIVALPLSAAPSVKGVARPPRKQGAAPPLHRRAQRLRGDPPASAQGAPRQPRRASKRR